MTTSDYYNSGFHILDTSSPMSFNQAEKPRKNRKQRRTELARDVKRERHLSKLLKGEP